MELLKHFHKLTIYPENAKKLKNLILDLAVRGKLTEEWRNHNFNEELGADVLLKIKKEKSRQELENKGKQRIQNLEQRKEEEPFEIPKSWIWCSLDNIAIYIQRGKSPKYSEEQEIPVVSQKCIQWAGFDISRANFIEPNSIINYSSERLLQEGDLLWNSTGDGTIGRVNLFPKTKFQKVVADSHVTIVRVLKEFVSPKYLLIYTSSSIIQNSLSEKVTGSTKQTELGTGTVKNFPFPLPPVAEQTEIVILVDKLFREVEALEKETQERIALKEKFGTATLNQLVNSSTSEELAKNWPFTQKHFPTFFNEEANIKKLRETILQLAVQGKLTADWRKQNPNVEPASELLKRIKAEKEKLIAEKKIKKETPLPPISDEEKPYELPDGWVWCRLNDLGNIVGGGTPSMGKKEYWGGNIPWISPKDMKENFISDSEMKVTEEGVQNSSAKIIPRGSILLVARSGILKRKLPVSINTVECTVNQDLKVVVPYLEFSNRFIHLLLLGLEKVILSNFVKFGMTVHSLKYEEFASMPIPLPPAKEQHAILDKVNNLMSLCDELETRVKQSKEEVERLMEAVLREVFEVREEVESVL